MPFVLSLTQEVLNKLNEMKVEKPGLHDDSASGDWKWWSCDSTTDLEATLGDILRLGIVTVKNQTGTQVELSSVFPEFSAVPTNSDSNQSSTQDLKEHKVVLAPKLHAFMLQYWQQKGIGTDARKYVESGLINYAMSRDHMPRMSEKSGIGSDLVIQSSSELEIGQHAHYTKMFFVDSEVDVNFQIKLKSRLYLDEQQEVQYRLDAIKFVFETLDDYKKFQSFLNPQNHSQEDTSNPFHNIGMYFNPDKAMTFDYKENTLFTRFVFIIDLIKIFLFNKCIKPFIARDYVAIQPKPVIKAPIIVEHKEDSGELKFPTKLQHEPTLLTRQEDLKKVRLSKKNN